MFTASVGLLLAGHLPVGGERGQELVLPGVQRASEAMELWGVGAGAAVQDLPELVLGVSEVVAALVEQHELLGDDPRLCELSGRVTQDQGVLQLGPLPGVQGRERPAQEPPAAVERVVPVTAPAQGPDVLTW